MVGKFYQQTKICIPINISNGSWWSTHFSWSTSSLPYSVSNKSGKNEKGEIKVVLKINETLQ
jgi:hypothetical protein